jgi:hypothetical protein
MSKQFCRKDSTIHGVGRLAKVLSDGLPLKGIGEALCIGAAGLFWWPYTGDRVGTHPSTGVNLHRYLLPLDAEGFYDKQSTLLLRHTRREVWSIHQNHEASSRRCQLPWSTYLSEVITMTMIRRLDLNKNIFAS